MDVLKLPHQHGDCNSAAHLQAQLSRIDHFQIVTELFKQLGDTTRIRIFWLLCHCETCVTDISALLAMSSPAVSHHLRLLRDNKLLVCRRVGKEVYYSATGSEQSQLLHQMIEKMMEMTCPD